MRSEAIAEVDAWQVMDSRGRPTVAAAVQLANGHRGVARVPSGASTGMYEAHELRDHSDRWLGWAVGRAVDNVRGPIHQALRGLNADDREEIDGVMLELDGSSDLSRLGANAVLAVSIAVAQAVAASRGRELWQYLRDDDGAVEIELPMPMVNIVSGGAHAGGLIDIQDVLVIPHAAHTFAEAIEWCFKTREATGQVARERGVGSPLVADEGGVAASLRMNEDALRLVVDGIVRAGFEPGTEISLAIDVAASSFCTEAGRYSWVAEGRELDRFELLDELAGWVQRYPLVSIEDALGENDADGWALAADRLRGVQLIGDDLFATNLGRLQESLHSPIATSILIKPNQNGTLSGTKRVMDVARGAGMTTVVSARSGETEDTWLADLAIGWNAGQLKVGSTTRSERTAKWNRLLEVEHRWGARTRLARYPGSLARSARHG